MFKKNVDITRRARKLQGGKPGKGPVVYWMDRDQRVHDNWALLWAQQEACVRKEPLIVLYCFTTSCSAATDRSSHFLLEGLAELEKELSRHKIGFVLTKGLPSETVPQLLKELHASIVVTDFNPLQLKRKWLKQLSNQLALPIYEVDAHNIIPAWVVSDKKEYAAYTIRPKIRRLLDDYLSEPPQLLEDHPYSGQNLGKSASIDIDTLTKQVNYLKKVPPISLQPGERAAREAMQEALETRLPRYSAARNDPNENAQSGLSPYLHFGQLSPQRLALSVRQSKLADCDKDEFLEELIIRRELSDNYCYYERSYDSFSGFPAWAQKTLNEHRADKRDYCYTLEHLERGETHEPLWNACQKDLVLRGKLHGYLRMYWAKKILEWSESPEQAIEQAVILNDRYSLDGCDPNGYAGIAWAIGGVHDRAWQERPVFGKIRYMVERGCRRKFDVDRYIQHIDKQAS